MLAQTLISLFTSARIHAIQLAECAAPSAALFMSSVQAAEVGPPLSLSAPRPVSASPTV